MELINKVEFNENTYLFMWPTAGLVTQTNKYKLKEGDSTYINELW
jgi:hypothetical protein